MLQLDPWRGTGLLELPPGPAAEPATPRRPGPDPQVEPAPPVVDEDRPTTVEAAPTVERRQRWRAAVSAAVAVLVVAGLGLVWPRSFGGAVSYVKVSGTSMLPTFKRGDLVVVRSHASYRVGDVVAYRIPRGEFGAGNVVIHRIVGGSSAAGYVTKGDNRATVDQWRPRPADVLGRRWLVVAGAGRWFGWFRAPLRLGLLCAGLTFALLLLGPAPGSRRRRAGGPAPAA